MTFSMAVAGKGGSGKTSLSSLMIRYLKKHQLQPILAVDADPNANLAESLGLEARQTVGSIIAGFNHEKVSIPAGMTKEAYLGYKLNGAIIESPGLDLLVMGRGEGPECYCYPNLIVRKLMDSLSGNYAFVVMDNEAGMEHLSRRTTQHIDVLFLVSDYSIKGLRTVARLKELVRELKLDIKKQFVIINFVPGELDKQIKEEMARLGIEPLIVPLDEKIREYDLDSRSLLDLPETAKAVRAVDALMLQLLQAETSKTR